MEASTFNAPLVIATPCHRYRVELQTEDASAPQLCRSLTEVYDLLRDQKVERAVLAQRTSYDEMVGQPAEEGMTFLDLPIPGP